MSSPNFSLTILKSKLSESRHRGQPFTLLCSDLVAALHAFLEGRLTAAELADWAEFFDANEHVEFESDELIPDVLFALSSPEINGLPTEQRVREMLDVLLDK